MAWKSRLTFPVSVTICRSTRSCWSAVVESRTCRVCDITLCVDLWMRSELQIGSRPAPSMERSGRSSGGWCHLAWVQCKPFYFYRITMPRGQFFGHREAQPDSKYRDKLVGKFLNVLMGGGKKSTAERICYGAF